MIFGGPVGITLHYVGAIVQNANASPAQLLISSSLLPALASCTTTVASSIRSSSALGFSLRGAALDGTTQPAACPGLFHQRGGSAEQGDQGETHCRERQDNTQLMLLFGTLQLVSLPAL